MVSFIIPCYRLGHLLPECVGSIFSQTYSNFEVLIMDDSSPDNTPEVASSFRDSRIKYVRNECNLGQLRNYNKGIGLSRGKYVWLISADDYLRQPYILQRYVELMEEHPRIGYTFCPVAGLRNGEETGVLAFSMYGTSDRIVKGHIFLRDLLGGNMVASPSAMVRRECYEQISLFPLDVTWAGSPADMNWCGDWYLWCVFGLAFDVGYFAEPMVCYREHDLGMTAILTRPDTVESCRTADVALPWLIRERANEKGLGEISEYCLHAIAREYARQAAGKEYRSSMSLMTAAQFEESIRLSTESESERNWIRARFYVGQGDGLFSRGDWSSAVQSYRAALRADPRMIKVYAKLLLLSLGRPGGYARRTVRKLRATHLPVRVAPHQKRLYRLLGLDS
jgi:glycosyltransferase involved in cell wall biosynthesis